MNWLVASTLSFSQTAFEEGQAFADQAIERIDESAMKFLQELYEKAHLEQSDCPCKKQARGIPQASPQPVPAQKALKSSKIRIFISFSVPIDTWLDYSTHLEQLNGEFVIRGLPENSFQILSQKMMEFRKHGINAPVQIDPEAFELYRISVVPTISLEEETHRDQISGNIRLDAALQKFLENGSTKSFARDNLNMLAHKNVSNVGNIFPEKREPMHE